MMTQYKSLLGFHDEKLPGFDDLEHAIFLRVKMYEELQLGVIQYIEPLKEKLSVALNLQNFDLIVQNALGRYELGEPWCLQIEHVGDIILEHVEQANLKWNLIVNEAYMSFVKVHLELLLVVGKELHAFAEKLDLLAVLDLETHFI